MFLAWIVGWSMSRVCEHCNFEITNKYLLRQNDYEKILCSNCGRGLKVTSISKLVYRYTQILMAFMLLLLPINFVGKIAIECLWIGVSIFLLPAFVYNYEKIIKWK